MLPLPALRVFEAASRHRSFRHAAAELHLSASAVSHAIRRLEQGLGVALFARDGRTVQLTAAGETLMRHVSRGFAELQAGVAAIGVRGPLLFRLHCAPSFAAQWLAPRLPRLLAQHPALEVRLHADANYSRFSADEYDADIIYGLPRTPGLVVVPLGEEVMKPLCPPRLAEGLRTPADLPQHSLITSDNKMIRWSDWFAANAKPQPPRREGHGSTAPFCQLAQPRPASASHWKAPAWPSVSWPPDAWCNPCWGTRSTAGTSAIA